MVKLLARCLAASGGGLVRRAESAGMGVFLSGESGGLQEWGGRGDTQEPEWVEMDMVSRRLSGLLSRVERLVLPRLPPRPEGLHPRVDTSPNWN